MTIIGTLHYYPNKERQERAYVCFTVSNYNYRLPVEEKDLSEKYKARQPMDGDRVKLNIEITLSSNLELVRRSDQLMDLCHNST